MKKEVPVLDLKTIEEFLPGWHEEMRRVGSIGRPTERVVFGRICCKTKPVPAKVQQAKDFA